MEDKCWRKNVVFKINTRRNITGNRFAIKFTILDIFKRQALFVVSVLTTKPVFVVSVLTGKPVFVVSVGLRVFQKIWSLPNFVNLENEII